MMNMMKMIIAMMTLAILCMAMALIRRVIVVVGVAVIAYVHTDYCDDDDIDGDVYRSGDDNGIHYDYCPNDSSVGSTLS